MSKVVGLIDEYSLEVEELHIKILTSQITAKKVSFSKIMVNSFSQLLINSFGFICQPGRKG